MTILPEPREKQPITGKDIANSIAGTAANKALSSAGLGGVTMATSIGGDVLSKYISDSDRIINKFQKDGTEQGYVGRYGKEGTMSYQFEKFTEYYAEQYQKPGVIKGMAQTIAGTAIGDGWFKEGFATSMQFKTMIENHGSMQEYEEMNKRMGGDLQLPAYVKFRAEANEELLRLANGKRDVSKLNDEARDAIEGALQRYEQHQDVNQLRIEVYHSAGKHLGDKFIERGGKNQYNRVEKDLWDRGYLLSENAKDAPDGKAMADNGKQPVDPKMQGVPEAALASASKIGGDLQKSGGQATPDDLGIPSVNASVPGQSNGASLA